MKTRILYVGLVLAVVALGALAVPGLLAPVGVATEPQGGKDDIVPPAAPGPAQDLRSQEPKLRHTLQESPSVGDLVSMYMLFSMTKCSLAFTPDGKTLVGASQNIWGGKNGGSWTGAMKLWDVTTGKERASFPTEGGVRWFALTADGKTLAVVPWGKKLVKLWDVASGKERALVEVTVKPVMDTPSSKDWAFVEDYGSVAFTPDGKTLAVGGLETIKLWDVSTGKERAGLKLEEIKVVDASTGKERAGLKPCGPYCRVAFSADGKLLAAVSDSAADLEPGKEIGAVTLWDVATGQQRDPLPGADGGFSSVAFTPDGKTLAAAGAGIVLWDVTTGQELATLKADQGKVESLAFTADGKTLASAGGPRSELLVARPRSSVRLWDMASGRVKATFKGFRSPPSYMAFAPDGKTLATFGLGELKLWDIPASKQADK